jgi:hypothetical protein
MIGRRTLAAAAVLAFADTTARAQDQSATARLRDELMALERQGWEYMKARDRAALRRFLADDLLQIFADGDYYYKDGFLTYMVDYRIDDYDIDPTVAVRVIDPTVAALVYGVTSRGTRRFGLTKSEKVVATSLYVRRDGQWANVLYQETPIK